jgi:hypothetical protein
LGWSLKNNGTAATPTGEFGAIHHTLGVSPEPKITDLFVLHIDTKEMQQWETRWDNEPDGPVPVKMIDGDIRDRLRKFRPNSNAAQNIRNFFGNRMDEEIGGTVHAFVPNDKTDFDMHTHVLSLTVRELLPYAFSNPKDISSGAGRIIQ